MFKHDLGLKVETKVSKLKGIITSRSECLYGCNRYYVQPEVGKDLKQPDGWWVDEDDITVKGKGVVTQKKDTGGMMAKDR
jgi:hypothetical protein